jgi:hypothetical protein
MREKWGNKKKERKNGSLETHSASFLTHLVLLKRHRWDNSNYILERSRN